MYHHLKQYLKLQWSAKLLIYTVLRMFFGALLIFEFLNLMGVLTFTLDFTWRGLFITALITFLILEAIAYKYYREKKYMLHWMVWVVLAISLSLDASADIFHLYGRYQWWDKAVHCFNSAAICFGIFIVVGAFWIDTFNFRLLTRRQQLRLSLLLAGTITMTLSALYEIEEYTEDILYHTNRLGPGTDTADDLLFNALGAAAMIIVLWITMSYTRKKPAILT